MVTVARLVELTQLEDADSSEFHKYRKEALSVAMEVFKDRAQSYNVTHEPYREMPFGIVSLVSELFKRMVRLTSLVSPTRGEQELRQEDLDRIIDTMTDAINYASWGYAMARLALEEIDGASSSDGHTGQDSNDSSDSPPGFDQEPLPFHGSFPLDVR